MYNSANLYNCILYRATAGCPIKKCTHVANATYDVENPQNFMTDWNKKLLKSCFQNSVGISFPILAIHWTQSGNTRSVPSSDHLTPIIPTSSMIVNTIYHIISLLFTVLLAGDRCNN